MANWYEGHVLLRQGTGEAPTQDGTRSDNVSPCARKQLVISRNRTWPHVDVVLEIQQLEVRRHRVIHKLPMLRMLHTTARDVDRFGGTKKCYRARRWSEAKRQFHMADGRAREQRRRDRAKKREDGVELGKESRVIQLKLREQRRRTDVRMKGWSSSRRHRDGRLVRGTCGHPGGVDVGVPRV